MIESAHKYLIFTMSGCYYAFDLRQIAEVVENPATCPIPLVPPYYHGAMNFHGTIVAVMDLAMFFGFPGGHGLGKVIVLDNRIASLAFSVEGFIRITPYNLDTSSDSPANEPYSLGKLQLSEGKVILLDAAAIAEHTAETIND